MCGIVGKIHLDGGPITIREIDSMRSMLLHRGPDDSGNCLFSLESGRSYTPANGCVESHSEPFSGALGFNRLSIIDLSRNGHQPMHSLDGGAIIIFNGEIYNADEYRHELETRGYRFRGNSDTEILLNLYCCFGIDEALARLNGMFAFCIVDLRKREMHLARDRLGIKPLYVYQNSRALMFASEVKAFLPSNDFIPAINEDVIDEFVKFGHVAGAETLFHGVSNVEPGELLTLRNGKLRSRFYWSIPPADTQASLTSEEAQNAVENALSKSVRYRLKSDVKVGCQLSGGIDSSLISLFATRHRQVEKTTAVSVVHTNSKFNEEPWIDEVSGKLGIPVEKILLTEKDFFDNIGKATWHRDLPVNSPSTIPILLMSKLAKKHFTVFLSGEGADELFGGYERFFGAHFLENPLNYHLLRMIPVANRLLKQRYISEENRPFDIRDWFISQSSYIGCEQLQQMRPDYDSVRFMEKRRQIFDAGDGSLVSRAQQYETRTWLVDLLLRQDTMTMAHSVENRVPFLDHNLVELARQLPIKSLVGKDPRYTRSTKVVLKHTAAKHFGKRFAYRRKIGFEIPLAEYFSTPIFDSWLRDEILPGIQARGIFDSAGLRRFYKKGKISSYQDIYSMWRMVTLEVWAQMMLSYKKPHSTSNHCQL
tara:strand:- start:3627 stop:5579 length:1953 start_codon:yes stop_codon:yes gene_type:complete